MTDNKTLQKIDSLEIRPVANGFIAAVRTEDGETEHVFDSHQKTLRFIKKLITDNT